MIYFLKGNVERKLEESLVLDSNGIGYEVYVGSKVLNKVVVGEEIRLYTQVYFNDPDFSIYGFLEEGSLALFKLLKSVSGVGPKSAYSILSNADFGKIQEAISKADKSFFKEVKGVGSKTAMKIIVELQDKVGKINELSVKTFDKEENELIEALESMGYQRVNIVSALEEIEGDLNEEQKIQKAIKIISSSK